MLFGRLNQFVDSPKTSVQLMKSNVEMLRYVGSYFNVTLLYVVRFQGVGLETSRSDSNEGNKRSEGK